MLQALDLPAGGRVPEPGRPVVTGRRQAGPSRTVGDSLHAVGVPQAGRRLAEQGQVEAENAFCLAGTSALQRLGCQQHAPREQPAAPRSKRLSLRRQITSERHLALSLGQPMLVFGPLPLQTGGAAQQEGQQDADPKPHRGASAETLAVSALARLQRRAGGDERPLGLVQPAVTPLR